MHKFAFGCLGYRDEEGAWDEGFTQELIRNRGEHVSGPPKKKVSLFTQVLKRQARANAKADRVC